MPAQEYLTMIDILYAAMVTRLESQRSPIYRREHSAALHRLLLLGVVLGIGLLLAAAA